MNSNGGPAAQRSPTATLPTFLLRDAGTLLFLLASNALCLLAVAQFKPTGTLSSSPTFSFVCYRGRSLPLAMDAPVYKNIYSGTTEGVGEKQLTHDNHSFNPVLSPDGARIAYVHIRPDTCEGCFKPAEYELFLMNADGTDPHSIAELDGPVTIGWSPDSKALAYGKFPFARDLETPFCRNRQRKLRWMPL
jgi:hypothetical protein